MARGMDVIRRREVGGELILTPLARDPAQTEVWHSRRTARWGFSDEKAKKETSHSTYMRASSPGGRSLGGAQGASCEPPTVFTFSPSPPGYREMGWGTTVPHPPGLPRSCSGGRMNPGQLISRSGRRWGPSPHCTNQILGKERLTHRLPGPCTAPGGAAPLAFLRVRHVQRCLEHYISQLTSRWREVAEWGDSPAWPPGKCSLCTIFLFKKTMQSFKSFQPFGILFWNNSGIEKILQKRFVRHDFTCLNPSPDRFLTIFKSFMELRLKIIP